MDKKNIKRIIAREGYMKKIILTISCFLLLTSFVHGEMLPKGDSYPIKTETMKKLQSMLGQFNVLFQDINSSYFGDFLGTSSGSNGDKLAVFFVSLNLEFIHARAGQFNTEAISYFRLLIPETIKTFEATIEACNKTIGTQGMPQGKIIYADKLKNLDREAIDLLQEVDRELTVCIK